MEYKSFVRFLASQEITEGWRHNDKAGVHIYEPALIKKGGQHPELPNALNHNGKNMFYSFDLTNICDRGCPGCYVARGVEISCNGVAKVPLKEYKGDLRKWEDLYHIAKQTPEQFPAKKMRMTAEQYVEALDDTKKQVNANGGIRMFSAADYPDASSDFYKQIMKKYGITDKDYFKTQVSNFLNDAHETGWHVKAITKEKKFLKDHIDHPALKGVDVSMNAQGFGESHESVKNLRKGKHEDFSPKENKVLKANAHKIIGRTVTHTPFDLQAILDHKKDHSHIGVITSGHDIPGSGIRYTSSVPKDPMSPKTIIIQKNFPKQLMSILDGSLSPESLKEDIEATEDPKHTIKVTLVKQPDGKWHEETFTSKTGETTTKKVGLNASGHLVVPNLEADFEKRNPNFTHTFSNEDAQFLLSKMEGKMCCAGEKEGEAVHGKCHNCKAKCGVEGATKGGQCKTFDPMTLHKVAKLLNKYAKDYNDTVNRVRSEIQSGRVVVNEIKDSKGYVPDIRSNPTDNIDTKDKPDVDESFKKFTNILEKLTTKSCWYCYDKIKGTPYKDDFCGKGCYQKWKEEQQYDPE